VNLLPGNPMM
jgi:hypothetical protein